MRTNKKILSSEEIAFIKLIDDNELLFFDFEQIKSLSKQNKVDLQALLSGLTSKKLLFVLRNLNIVSAISVIFI